MQELQALFRLYYQDVYRYLYSLCRDSTLAEDLASETFLQALKALPRFRGDSDVKTWLFSIARYQWYGWMRKNKRQGTEEIILEELAGGELPEDTLCRQELIRRIQSLVKQLPERTQQIMQQRFAGQSFFVIGQALGISESSARVLFFRGKQKIKESLEKEEWIDG